MLPQDAVVLFMHTDHLAQLQRVTEFIDLIEIKIIDFTEAVASQFQRVDLLTKDCLTQIKRMIHVVIPRSIAIGHHQFTQRGPVHYGSMGIAITKRQGMQDQPFFGRKPHPKTPVLPLDRATVYFEVRAIRLRNIKRCQRLPLVQPVRPIITQIRRQRHDAVILNPQNFSIVQINHRHKAFYGSDVGVVLWIFPKEAVCPGMTEMFFIGLGEIRYGKAFNMNLLGVRYPPTLKSRKEIRMLTDNSPKLSTFFIQKRYPCSRNHIT